MVMVGLVRSMNARAMSDFPTRVATEVARFATFRGTTEQPLDADSAATLWIRKVAGYVQTVASATHDHRRGGVAESGERGSASGAHADTPSAAINTLFAVTLSDFFASMRNGCGAALLFAYYRPDLVDIAQLVPEVGTPGAWSVSLCVSVSRCASVPPVSMSLTVCMCVSLCVTLPPFLCVLLSPSICISNSVLDPPLSLFVVCVAVFSAVSLFTVCLPRHSLCHHALHLETLLRLVLHTASRASCPCPLNQEDFMSQSSLLRPVVLSWVHRCFTKLVELPLSTRLVHKSGTTPSSTVSVATTSPLPSHTGVESRPETRQGVASEDSLPVSVGYIHHV